MADKSTILVLDDQMLIAFEVCHLLEKAGYGILGPFGNVQSALEALNSQRPDAAILDINMGDETTSEALADELMKQSIPFAFLTGYGSAGVLGGRFDGITRLSKPARPNVLVDTLTSMI